MSPIPFGDYSGNDDAVTARLEFAMPDDIEQKLSGVHKAVESIKTSLESTNRFTKNFVDYMAELPKVQEEIEKLHQTHNEGLEKTAQHLDALHGNATTRAVSTPISVRTPGVGGPQIPESPQPTSATPAHEHLPENLTTTPPPPTASTPAPQSDQPVPHQYSQTGESAPLPAHLSSAVSSSVPPAPTTVASSSPATHIPDSTPPKVPEHRAETTPSFSSSAPAPVNRPPSPIPTAERPTPAVPVPVHETSTTSTPKLPTLTTPILPEHHPSEPPAPPHPQHETEAATPQRPSQHVVGSGTSPTVSRIRPAEHTSGQTVIHADVVNIHSSDTAVSSDQSHVHSAAPTTVHSSGTTNVHPPQPTTTTPHPLIQHIEAAHASGSGPSLVNLAQVPHPTTSEPSSTSDTPTRVIGHIPQPPSHPSAPSPSGTHPATLVTPTHTRLATGDPVPRNPTGRTIHPTLKSQLDYRARLAQEIGNDPAQIWDRLHQRGLTSEKMEHGKVKYEAKLGDKTVSADEFMNNKALHEDALDTLAKESGPQSAENGTPIQRVTRAARMVGEAGRAAKAGKHEDVTRAVQNVGELVGSMGKAGGALEGVGDAIGAAGPALGVAGGAVGAVLGANALVQEGGQRYQDLKNEGMNAHGGGAMQGAQIEGSIAMMGLNPFITNEQSRQIIMGALQTGNTGQAYDNTVEFMKNNLVDMNMSVADSTRLLEKNVKEGGQSVQSLGLQLGTLKTLSQTGSTTFADAKAEFEKTTSATITQGARGTAAGREALTQGEINNEPLPSGEQNPARQATSNTFQQANTSQTMAAIIGSRFDPGLDPNAVIGTETNRGTWTQHVMQIQAEDAQRARQSAGSDPAQQAALFARLQKAHGITLSQQDAQQLMGTFNSPENAGKTPEQYATDQTRDAQKKQADAQHNVTTKNGRNLGDFLSAGVSAFEANSFFEGSEGRDKAEGAFQARSGEYSNPALDKVVQQYGLSGTVAYDPQGKPHKIDYNDKDQMEGLQSGTWKVAGADNPTEKQKLSDNFEGEGAALQHKAQGLTDLAASGMQDDGSSGGSGGKFDLTPQAAELLKLLPGGVTSDPNTLNSNAGQGGATANSAAPGNAGIPGAVPKAAR